MLIAILVTAAALCVVALCLFTKPGQVLTTRLRVALSWLWLTRVSTLGLLVLLAFPLLARGPARTVVIGAYDLHGDSTPGLVGAACVGLLLALAVWTVFVTEALTLSYGKKRTGFEDDPPPYFGFTFRLLLPAALALNVWTILAATDGDDRNSIAWALLI